MRMEKCIAWLRMNERKLLVWANKRSATSKIHQLWGSWLSVVTHMGGATFTLTTALLWAWLAPASWQFIGWQCLTAVALSHLPVAIVKRKFKRLRPYQALPAIYTNPKPLIDSSFPSGHTTAIFAWLTPIMLGSQIDWYVIAPALFIGISVAWSRMYLGLHYPSDVAAGAVLGTATAYGVHFFWMTS